MKYYRYFCPKCGRELFPSLLQCTNSFECSCGWWRDWTGSYDRQTAKKEEYDR